MTSNATMTYSNSDLDNCAAILGLINVHEPNNDSNDIGSDLWKNWK